MSDYQSQLVFFTELELEQLDIMFVQFLEKNEMDQQDFEAMKLFYEKIFGPVDEDFYNYFKAMKEQKIQQFKNGNFSVTTPAGFGSHTETAKSLLELYKKNKCAIDTYGCVFTPYSVYLNPEEVKQIIDEEEKI